MVAKVPSGRSTTPFRTLQRAVRGIRFAAQRGVAERGSRDRLEDTRSYVYGVPTSHKLGHEGSTWNRFISTRVDRGRQHPDVDRPLFKVWQVVTRNPSNPRLGCAPGPRPRAQQRRVRHPVADVLLT